MDASTTAAMLLHHVRAVVTALDGVLAQMPVPDEGLGAAARRVEGLAGDLVSFTCDESSGSLGPALLPLWHPAAFEVRSSRPRVLMTVGLNALRVLKQTYDDVLESHSSDRLIEIATDHRERLRAIYNDLADADWWAVA